MARVLNNKSKTQKLKVLIAMSGGVDSSVAAALLVEQGYDVVGGFIKNYSDSKDLWTGECAWMAERRDAIRVAARFGIPLITFDFEKYYKKYILGRMFREYKKGITPNPDVLCNEEIKFGLFFKEAMKRKFDFVATGHYAQIKVIRNEIRLMKGKDSAKDQSYFLYRLSQTVLKKTLFPIGHLRKVEVRKLASQFSLPNSKKPDSQGICFVGKLNFHEFLRKKIKSNPGKIIMPNGNIIGTHDGLDAYTVGQRHGMRVSSDQRAWYVVGKDKKKNELIVVPNRDHPLLYSNEAYISKVNWTTGSPLKDGSRVEVVIRYRQKPVKAIIIKVKSKKKELGLHFLSQVWALAPGQSAVLYQGTECLGGGFILETKVGLSQHGFQTISS